MKRHILYIGALAFTAFGLQSCLDYDDPGDEMGANEVKTDATLYQGKAKELNYEIEISTKGLKDAADALKNQLSQTTTGQYCLRGAKNGEPPAAHAYQRQFSMGPDCYAQYFVVPHKDFMYGTLTSTYNNSKEFNGDPHSSYTMVKNALVPVLNHPSIDSIPEMKAINLLFFTLSAQERCDLSGPFTYEEDLLNSETPSVYNSLEAIYTDMEQNLTNIVACLEYYEKHRSSSYKAEVSKLMSRYVPTSPDLIWGTETGMSAYIKLANSIKLRMAMNIVKVDPAKAQKWAEEAVKGGVIEAQREQVGLTQTYAGFTHPLTTICNGWNDLRLSASMESLLMSLNHPYKDIVFALNNNSIINQVTKEETPANTRLIGIRSGELVGDGQNNPPNSLIAYSSIKSDAFSYAPLYFVKFAEVDFLRAEGALRGWDMGGDAQFFYERGIRNACLADLTKGDDPAVLAYNEAVEEYMEQETAIEYVQTDPLFGKEGWPSLTKIGVKWNDSDSEEVKLEKIITQKYIALFPNSWQAWTDLRRTGYPKLFPVQNTSDGDGSIVQGDMIRRIPWQATDPQVQANIQQTGLDALGGPDLQATRLWWDVDAPNF